MKDRPKIKIVIKSATCKSDMNRFKKSFSSHLKGVFCTIHEQEEDEI